MTAPYVILGPLALFLLGGVLVTLGLFGLSRLLLWLDGRRDRRVVAEPRVARDRVNVDGSTRRTGPWRW